MLLSKPCASFQQGRRQVKFRLARPVILANAFLGHAFFAPCFFCPMLRPWPIAFMHRRESLRRYRWGFVVIVVFHGVAAATLEDDETVSSTGFTI